MKYITLISNRHLGKTTHRSFFLDIANHASEEAMDQRAIQHASVFVKDPGDRVETVARTIYNRPGSTL